MTNPLLPRIFSPAVLLYVFVVITQIGHGIYVVTEGETPPSIALANTLGTIWIVGWWLRRDSQRRGITWPIDLGMFLYILWPFFMPYYLLKTRGARGLLVVLGFAAAFFGGYMFGVLAAVVFIVGIQ